MGVGVGVGVPCLTLTRPPVGCLPSRFRFRDGIERNALAKPYAKYTNARSTIEGEICTKRESLLGSMVGAVRTAPALPHSSSDPTPLTTNDANDETTD